MNDQVDPTKPMRDTAEEAFAIRVATGEDVHAAFKGVWGKGNKPQAYAKREDPNIDARICFLQEARADEMLSQAGQHVTLINYTKETALAESHAAFRLAMELQDPRAAIAAVGMKAKIAGHLNESTREPKSLRDLSLNSIEALLKEAKDRRVAMILAATDDAEDDAPTTQH